MTPTTLTTADGRELLLPGRPPQSGHCRFLPEIQVFRDEAASSHSALWLGEAMLPGPGWPYPLSLHTIRQRGAELLIGRVVDGEDTSGHPQRCVLLPRLSQRLASPPGRGVGYAQRAALARFLAADG